MIIKNSKIPKWASIVIDVYAITLWPFVFIYFMDSFGSRVT